MTGVPTLPSSAGPSIAAKLAKRLRSYARPTPVAAPLLAHEALKCPRRIGFRLFGVTPDLPLTASDQASFEDGDFVDSIAAEVFAQERNGRIQLPFHWLPDVPLKGKCDVGYRSMLDRKTVVEVKSANEKAWSRAVGMWEGVPASPKPEWLIQAGLAACSPPIDAPQVHIVLVDSERFEVAEWIIGVDDPLDLPEYPEPVTVRSLVADELARQRSVLVCCEGGTLPPRDVPGFGIVQDPPARDDVGDPWQCKYCRWQPSCAKLAAGPVHDYGEMVA